MKPYSEVKRARESLTSNPRLHLISRNRADEQLPPLKPNSFAHFII